MKLEYVLFYCFVNIEKSSLYKLTIVQFPRFGCSRHLLSLFCIWTVLLMGWALPIITSFSFVVNVLGVRNVFRVMLRLGQSEKEI